MSLRRASMVLQILATVACGEIVGIHDVPTPIDGSSDGAPVEATAVDGRVADSSEAVADAANEASENDGSLGDVASPPGDAFLETSTQEASADASGDASPDAASCSAQWNPANAACNACGIEQCCGQLATCQMLDDGGLDHGVSRCAYLVICITGYTGTNPPGSHDTICMNDLKDTSSEFTIAEAALTCVRTMCSSVCDL